jgi:hypothetical protein
MRLLLALLGSLLPAVAVAEDATTVAHPLPWADRAYGEKGSREAGVSAGLMAAPGVYAATLSPQFGWFIADHLQISTILSLTRIDAGMDSATVATAILEPSYHYEIDRRTQMFAGIGFGYAYLSDQGHGATYAVRGGMQFLVGRGVLAPTISYELRTQGEKLAAHTLAYLATHNALRLNFGYTAIF